VERAGQDTAWGSLTRLTVARGRRVATVLRLQDCRRDVRGRRRSLSLALANTIGPEPHLGFMEFIGELALLDR